MGVHDVERAVEGGLCGGGEGVCSKKLEEEKLLDINASIGVI